MEDGRDTEYSMVEMESGDLFPSSTDVARSDLNARFSTVAIPIGCLARSITVLVRMDQRIDRAKEIVEGTDEIGTCACRTFDGFAILAAYPESVF